MMRWTLNESREDFEEEYWEGYDFAKKRHDATGAVRKATGAPYFVHPEGVAKIVHAYGGSVDQVKSAFAHDLMEDAGVTFSEVEDCFGEKVADIVEWLTNDPDEIARIGKQEYISRKLLSMPHEALLVKLADMYYNYYDHCPEKQAKRIINNLQDLAEGRDLTRTELDLIDNIITRVA